MDKKSSCGEVCLGWVKKQPAIGGPGIITEIDESKFGKRMYQRQKLVKEMWVFGGNEQKSKKRSVAKFEKRDEETLIPLYFNPHIYKTRSIITAINRKCTGTSVIWSMSTAL